MGAPIPQTIKIRVLRDWVSGLPRSKIASENNIGQGSVTNIIQQAKDNIPDIDLLREVAIAVRKTGMDLSCFSSAVRLKKILDRLGRTEEEFELLIEDIGVFCFEMGYDNKEFILTMYNLLKQSRTLEMSIHELPSYILKRKNEVQNLQNDISSLQKQKEKKLQEYFVTEKDFEEYRKSRPLQSTLDKLLDELEEKNRIIQEKEEELIQYGKDFQFHEAKRDIRDDLKEINKNNPYKHFTVQELSQIYEEVYFKSYLHVDMRDTLRQRIAKRGK
jgi:soluble cytochrome b562